MVNGQSIEIINPDSQNFDFAVYGINYSTLRELSYAEIVIPKGFVFDGVTVPAPFTLLFSNKDLRQGIMASCFHDWMCKHKDLYARKEATEILIEIWKIYGLNNFKAVIAKFAVNFFQWLKGW